VTATSPTASAGLPAGSLPAGSPVVRFGARRLASSMDALDSWRAHQPDRAWVEWGVCWPPVSVRRPRCVTCADRWPCEPALASAQCLIWSGRADDVKVQLPVRVKASRESRHRGIAGPCRMTGHGHDADPFAARGDDGRDEAPAARRPQ
jgi:hypothetical protein